MVANVIEIELTGRDEKAQAIFQRQTANAETFEKQLEKTARAGNNTKSANDALALAQAHARAATAAGEHAKAEMILKKALDGTFASEKNKIGAQIQLEAAQRKAAESSGSMLKNVAGMAAAFAGVGSVMAGISTVARAITAELDNAMERQKDAAIAQMKMPEVYETIRDNMGDDTAWGNTPEEREATTQKKIMELSAATGKTPEAVGRMFAQVQSAKAVTDDSDDVYDATLLALKSNPANSNSAKELAASALDLRGGNDTKSLKGQMGIIQATGAMSRIESISDVGKTLAPVNAAVQQSGGDIKLSQALVGMVSNAMVDKTGDQTRTTTINLVNDIMSAAPGATNPLEALGIVTKKGQAFAQDKAEFEKLESNHLRNKDQEHRFNELKTKHHDFLGIADKGEAAARPMRRSLFTGGDQYQKLMTNLNQKAVDEAGGEAVFDQKQRAIAANPFQNLADVREAGANIAEGLKTANTDEAMRGEVREIKAEIAKAAGDSAFEQMANSLVERGRDLFAAPSAKESAAELLDDVKQRAAVLRTPQMDETGRVYAQPAQADLDKAALLDSYLPRLVQVLEKLESKGVQAKVKNGGRDPRLPPEQRPMKEQERGGS